MQQAINGRRHREDRRVADGRRRFRCGPAGADGDLPSGGGRGAGRRGGGGGGGAAVRAQVHDGDAGVRRGVGLRQQQRHRVAAPAGRRRERRAGAVRRRRVRERVPWLHRRLLITPLLCNAIAFLSRSFCRYNHVDLLLQWVQYNTRFRM